MTNIQVNNQNSVSTRYFLKNYPKIKKNNDVVFIMNRQNTEGVFMSFKKWQNEFSDKSKKVSIKDLKKFFIKADKNLSKKINDIY